MMKTLCAFVLAGAFLVAVAGGAESPANAPSAAPAPATVPASAVDAPSAGLLGPLESGSRIIKQFDFDEKKLGNFDQLPMFWNKVGGRGYPMYTGGKFDEKVGRTPVSFRLDLDGGSVAYQYSAGQLKVNPNADYLVLGFVKTTALQHARAEITAWFADENNKVLASTEMHSERWASASGKDDWHVVHLFISGNNPAVRSLVLQVGLLQPQQLVGGRLGKYEIYEQDIKGSAWFDDIAVFELPRLAIHANAVGGLFAPHTPAELNLAVSDVNHAPLNVRLTVRDAAGTVVHQQEWPVQPTPEKPWGQKVTLPVLPPGFYFASMDVGNSRGLLTRRETRFACLGDVGVDARQASEFGIVATHWPVDAWDELPSINSQIGGSFIKLPVWRKDMTEDSLLKKDRSFDELLSAMQRQKVACIASFSEVPSALTGHLNDKAGDMLALMETDASVWRPYVNFILARYATRVEYWQVGSDRDTFSNSDPRNGRLFLKARDELASMVNSPKMVVPWNAMYEFDAGQFPGATVELSLPSAIKPQQLPAYIKSLTQNNTDVLALIEPLEEAAYPRIERIIDFAQRVILARTTAARGILLDLPMTYRDDIAGHVSEPTELLVVYRTLARELGGFAFKKEIALEPGIKAYLFDRAGVGTLVLWNEHAKNAQETVRLALGKTPQIMDLNGGISPVEMNAGVASITVGAMPVIVENVDSRLVELRGGFELTQKIFPAGAGSLTTTLKLHNPYKEPISGTLQLQMPAGWTADPPSTTFAIAPGGDLEQPVTIRYPFNEFAGPKVIGGRVTVDGDGVRSIDVMEHVTVASDIVEMECLAHFMPSGELVVLQTITNTSNQLLNAQAYVMIPGMPRQQRFVLDLPPSQTVIKRFVFPNAATVAGKVGAVGIRQNDGTTLLTRSVPLN